MKVKTKESMTKFFSDVHEKGIFLCISGMAIDNSYGVVGGRQGSAIDLC